jgi:hypothetical protein
MNTRSHAGLWTVWLPGAVRLSALRSGAAAVRAHAFQLALQLGHALRHGLERRFGLGLRLPLCSMRHLGPPGSLSAPEDPFHAADERGDGCY